MILNDKFAQRDAPIFFDKVNSAHFRPFFNLILQLEAPKSHHLKKWPLFASKSSTIAKVDSGNFPNKNEFRDDKVGFSHVSFPTKKARKKPEITA